ncbi:DUF3077 domain-containing protein [Pseudomonas sp. B7]|uniref:DUF3077 domain-containing protein n=1 Tax=Pseudomonas sp. B7 TaxID=360962 RepID=UPI00191D156C|nr:DUF3077 domain-containing protein [Pseudomonas sp. B7]MBL0793684.1 DUF3077 domain-containing protein [Pseudomonas sp. B7]
MYFFVLENDMTHPKNSTGHNRMQQQMLTTHSNFYHQSVSADGIHSRPLLAVQAGQDCEEALNSASMLLGAVDEIMTALTDEGMETNAIFGLRFLIESSKALVDSTTNAVMHGKSQGGAQ